MFGWNILSIDYLHYLPVFLSLNTKAHFKTCGLKIVVICHLSSQDVTKTGSQEQLDKRNNEEVKGFLTLRGQGPLISVNFAIISLNNDKVIDFVSKTL